MPLALALGLTAGGLVLSGVGAAANKSANDAAARERDAALTTFTGQQTGEFNRRQKYLTEGTKRIGDIKDQGFASLSGLRLANAKENAGIKTKYSNAGATRQLQTADLKDNIDTARNTLRDASDIELAGVTDAERGRQVEFQRQGTDLASRLVSNLGIGGFNRDAAYYDRNRTGQLTAATTGDGTTSTPFNVDPNSAYGKALAAESGNKVGMALDAARLRAGTAAAGDAATNQGRTISRSGEQIGILGRRAEGSRGALDPEMAAAKLVRENADKDADQRKANADADMTDYLDLLRQEQTGEEARVGQRQQAYDQLIQDVVNGSIQTEEEFLAAVNANSLNAEDALRQLTNYKMGGTVGSSFIGQLLSGAGSTLASAGAAHLFA